MSDTGNPDISAEIRKILDKVAEETGSHKRETADELAKAKRELTDLLTDAVKKSSEATDSQIRQLREALEEVTGFITEEKESRKNRDRVKDSEQTLVVPPDDVTVPDPPAPEPVYGDEDSKPSFFKRIW